MGFVRVTGMSRDESESPKVRKVESAESTESTESTFQPKVRAILSSNWCPNSRPSTIKSLDCPLSALVVHFEENLFFRFVRDRESLITFMSIYVGFGHSPKPNQADINVLTSTYDLCLADSCKTGHVMKRDNLMIECMSKKLEMSVLMSTIFVMSTTINAAALSIIIKKDENLFLFS